MTRKPAVDAFAAARPIDAPFLLLAALFLAALVVCNLIARKFVTVDLGFHQFVVSAGILPYPVTFLVTDMISELWGRRRASMVVAAGFAASLFVLGVVWLGDQFPAIAESPVSTEEYRHVIATNAWRTVFGSMVAYLAAQFVDVYVFHFWRALTKGRHLWLRNNGSTILSQFVDSTLVVVILFHDDPQWTGERMFSTIRDMWFLKSLMALVDTPLCYLGVAVLGRWRPRPL
ncbi:MAG: queuosine precursor transporter [Planctomycetota bacterium]